MMKRIFTLLMAAAMLTAVLCGCGSGNGNTPGESTNGTTTAPTQQQIIVPSFTTKPANDGKVTYTVTVVDQNGNPVAGVTIQFCDDANCKMPVATDENGVVTQKYAASEYHITLVELPAGYTTQETEFYFGEETELTIVVTAQ